MSLLRRNLGYKILSVAIAILLYVIASAQSGSRTPVEMFVTPEVTGIPPDLVLRSPPAGDTILLSGPPALIEAFRSQPVKATVDARDARPGVNPLRVVYRIPPSFQGRLTLVESQETTPLAFERPARQTLSVEVLYDNAPPAGYQFGEPEAIPRRATVVGLREEVERVKRLVANLDTAEASGAIDRNVGLIAQDAQRRVVDTVKVTPPQVHVRLALKKTPASKTVLLSPEFVGLPAQGYRLASYRFLPLAVTVTGEQHLLERLSSIDIPVAIDGLKAADVRRIAIPLPPGLVLEAPSTAELVLDIRPVKALANPPKQSAATLRAPTPTPSASPLPAPAPGETP